MKTTFIAVGDAFVTRRLHDNHDTDVSSVRQTILAHDVRFCNLEFTVHNKEGYPAAFSGGTWAMSEPEILDDLNTFGFNLYNTATNHSLDYSHGGLLATINHLKERQLLYAGTGENLAEASAPAYLDAPHARVAMIGAAASFHDSDIAGNSNSVLSGRPGLNPVRVQTTYHVQPAYYAMLKTIAEKTKMNVAQLRTIANGFAAPLPEGKMYFAGLSFLESDENAVHTAPLKKDMDRILQSIQTAKEQADYVLVSIHAHQALADDPAVPAEFLTTFAHACIDAGAHAILGHGPHELRGIEIYKDRPIFYSLGNFIFQSDTVTTQPAEAYENKGLHAESAVADLMNKRSANGTRGYVVQPNIWRSVMAGFTAEDGRITQIQLHPITLHMELPVERRGWPSIDNDENDAVLTYLADLSKPFGTDIVIQNHTGIINLKNK